MSKKVYKQGDIVFVPFPYDDDRKRDENKKRPAVIISNKEANDQKYICAKITSVLRGDKNSFKIEDGYVDRNIKEPSEVRTNEVFTAHHDIVIKKFAAFKKEPFKLLMKQFCSHLSID
ncbi:MAG: hypothetical protein RLZZ479_1551 [Bacteroidota bacterium]|jgi:mRNA-degrading endonuclease toxin of MazEF toxin-antitoxin module